MAKGSEAISMEMFYRETGINPDRVDVFAGMAFVDAVERGEPPANPSTIVKAWIEADGPDAARGLAVDARVGLGVVAEVASGKIFENFVNEFFRNRRAG